MVRVAKGGGAGQPDVRPAVPPRLGYGEYTVSEESAIGYARWAFLRAVERHQAAVLDDLSAEPLRLFRLGSARWGGPPPWPGEGQGYPFIPEDPEYRPFLASLAAWGARWRLNAPWCLEEAWGALRLHVLVCRFMPEYSGARVRWTPYLGDGSRYENRFKKERFAFEHDAWNPLAWTRAEYRRAITAAFEADLRDYLARIDAQARGTGLAPTPVKFKSAHFDWLALYQVRGWSYSELADADGRTPAITRWGVAKAVKDLAARIDLDLRPPDVN